MRTKTRLLLIAATLGLGMGGKVISEPATMVFPEEIAQYPEGVMGATLETLPVGNYGADGSANSSSWRKVAREGDRFCTEIANSPVLQYGGAIRILVSSLSLREGVVYIDALNRPILVGRPPETLSDDPVSHYLFGYDGSQSFSRGLRWKWWGSELRGDVSRLNTCLQATDSYQVYQCVWKDGSYWDATTHEFRPWTEAEKQQELASCQTHPNF